MTVVSALLRQRHNFYRVLLIVEVLALIGLRPLQQAPQLVSVVYLLIGGVPVLFDSPLLPQNRLSPQWRNAVIPQKDHHHLQRAIRRRRWLQYGWLGAAGVEVLWQLSLLLLPVVSVQLSVLHVAMWLALMLYVLWSLIGAPRRGAGVQRCPVDGSGGGLSADRVHRWNRAQFLAGARSSGLLLVGNGPHQPACGHWLRTRDARRCLRQSHHPGEFRAQ